MPPANQKFQNCMREGIFMETILVLVYIVAGWWAANRTIFANYAMFGTWNSIVLMKLFAALFLGWILIPIALIKVFLLNK
jgi:hypothetical protein